MRNRYLKEKKNDQKMFLKSMEKIKDVFINLFTYLKDNRKNNPNTISIFISI